MDELSNHFFEMADLAAQLHGRALLKFAKNDVRNAFHYGVGNIIAKYATSIGMTHAADVLVQSESDDRVIKQLRNVFGHRPALSQYLASQRGYLSLGVWHQFEDSLRTLYREAVPQAVRDADIAAEQARYHKPSKRPHIGIPTLWKRVADLAMRGRKPNKRALDRHWAVVDFWSAARNTIHTNTFYFGHERSLKIGKTHDPPSRRATNGFQFNRASARDDWRARKGVPLSSQRHSHEARNHYACWPLSGPLRSDCSNRQGVT